ncbi:MAG TPA: CAP domain-containing protein [Thermoanaerobaculia bacterium]|nr:CAP domain-containing protein [Thermoanaerobaculia bacterium]
MKLALVLAVALPILAADVRTELREHMLALVNRDRARHNLPAVQLDASAAWHADRFAEEQLETGAAGHFNLRGEGPHVRWSAVHFRSDHVNENASSWSTNRELTDTTIKDMMRRSQESMMAEEPPADGHRRAILDPWATHLAPGVAWKGGELRFSQIFLRRYVTLEPLPKALWMKDRVTIRGWIIGDETFDSVTVHSEPLPRPLTAKEASAISSYALPKRYTRYLPRLDRWRTYLDGTHGDVVIDKKKFTVEIGFNDGPGIYTIVVWIKPAGSGPIEVTNHAIRVEESPAAETLQVR